MSGALGLITADATSLVFQPAPLVIGDLILQGHEVPTRITIGGAQTVSIHKLPGGARIIDAMGADEGAVAWRGIFVGPEAAQRARRLDFMRMQGIPQVLSFGDYTFNVIIVDFQYDYRDRGAIISYRLKAEIIPKPPNVTVGLAFAVESDLQAGGAILQTATAAALSYATLAGKADAAAITAAAFNLNTVVVGLASAVASAGTIPASTQATTTTLQGYLLTAGSSVQGSISALSSGSFSSDITPLGFTSAGNLAATTAQAAVLAGAALTGGYINRINMNLAASGGSTSLPLVHS